jgi:hypothetical protein
LKFSVLWGSESRRKISRGSVFLNYSSALSIPKRAPIEGIRILVNLWILMKVHLSYNRQAVTTSVKQGHIIVNDHRVLNLSMRPLGLTIFYRIIEFLPFLSLRGTQRRGNPTQSLRGLQPEAISSIQWDCFASLAMTNGAFSKGLNLYQGHAMTARLYRLIGPGTLI